MKHTQRKPSDNVSDVTVHYTITLAQAQFLTTCIQVAFTIYNPVFCVVNAAGGVQALCQFVLCHGH